jgi:phospholipase C
MGTRDEGRPHDAQPGSAPDTSGSAPTAPVAAEPPESGSSAPSRRQFLTRAGFAAAGVAAGGVAGGLIGDAIGEHRGANSGTQSSQLGYQRLQPRSSPGFDHLVLVMFENRSFDNLLGYLYDPANLPPGQRFDGLSFGSYSNPDYSGNEIPAHPYAGETDFIMRQPSPDPGEQYDHVNIQLYDHIDPPENANLHGRMMLPPYNAPTPGMTASMRGFVHDYINDLRVKSGKEPGIEDYAVIMGSFTPEMLPVFSTLARSFAVYDAWHCAVPTQTFANRSFFHASTSHGFVTNEGGPQGIGKWFDPGNNSPTIFNRLTEAGIPWAIYFDDRQLISLTGFIHAPVLQRYWKSNFRTMSQFFEDVERGELPAYSFIEPRLVYDHNDMHPPAGVRFAKTVVDGDYITGGAISDVRAGDQFLHTLYSAIRASRSSTGSNAMNTMLLATFDEHGGIHDHVRPGPAVPPDGHEVGTAGEMGFRFDRLGLRVPAIAISAYTARNTIIHEEMHHAAVVATLSRKYGLRELTARDRDARTIDNAINLTVPRQPQDWPDTYPQYVPRNPEAFDPVPKGDDDRPLSPPGAGLMAMLTARYAPGQPVPTTYREAFYLIESKGRGLFGDGRGNPGVRA